MTLSKDAKDAIVDLIENKLAIMHIGDRDDLRERVALQKALTELRGLDPAEVGALNVFGDIPRRGRRRKVADMLEEQTANMIGERG